MTTTTAPAPVPLTEAMTLGTDVFGAIDRAIERTLTGVAPTPPEMTSAAKELAHGWITANVVGRAATVLQGALGVGPATNAPVDAVVVAGLVEARRLIDARIDAFQVPT